MKAKLAGVLVDVVDILDVFEVVPYISYDNCGNFRVFGRVQEDRAAHPLISVPYNALFLRKDIPNQVVSAKEISMELYPDPKPDCEVEINVAGIIHTIVTDKHGFYDETVSYNMSIPCGNISGTVTLKKFRGKPQKPISQIFPIVRMNPYQNRFGIISDIDDTILQSDVTNPMRLFYNTVFESPERRKPTTGTLEFYTMLHNGFGQENNPFFYISNSPWTLYRRLKTFIETQRFPLGPILLRDLTIQELRQSMHKKTTITRILSDFPTLSFVLVGDSGEKDLLIYQDIVTNFPNRIKLVLIRDVGNADKAAAAQNSMNYFQSPVPFRLVSNHEQSIQICKELYLLP